LWCRQLAAIWESWRSLHNYKLSPIQRRQNRFCRPTPTPSWRNPAHKIWRSQAWWTDKQTDKQTKKLNIFGRSGGGWNLRPTIGTVIEDLEHACFVTNPKNLLAILLYRTKGNPSSFLLPNSGWWATSPSTFNGRSKWPTPSKIAHVDRFPLVTSQQ